MLGCACASLANFRSGCYEGKVGGIFDNSTFYTVSFKKPNTVINKKCTLLDRVLFQLYYDIRLIYDINSEVTEMPCQTGVLIFKSLRRVISSAGSG